MHEPILITVVYGANEVSARRELWQGLIELAASVNLPWLVGGDFNAVLDMSEVSGASGDIRVAMHEFNDCIMQTGLISLPMQGERFSWHNCSTDGRSLWKRLDRMFVNDAWLERWPNLFYTCLTPRTSDHSPLVLKGDSRDVQVTPSNGTPMYSVTRKLKALKPVFRQQRRKKGDLAMNVKLAAGFLEIAQKLLQTDRHNSLLLQLENCCRLVYLKATQLEHVMLRQRAKLQWLKGGDQCSKVFFRRVATRRANKHLIQISDSDGLVQTDPTIINSVFVTYFQDLLGGDRTERVLDLHYLRPWARHILTEEEAYALIRPVTVDDVKKAMFDIEEDKAPGPDGKLLKQVNATVLTLIPKVRTPHSVADFRPISCCNVVYKVISKILVCRFREILDLLISPSQNAFVPVEWDFLFATLRLFGFPAVFIRWIEECVTSAHYSVVVNGGVHGFFAGARGLRQGDPMSPYLFVLVMEVLQMILQQFIDQDGQFLYHWRCTELKLFQLSFADDLLLLCKADVQSVSLFRGGLDLFASLSGLHTNPQKSQLIISKAASDSGIHYLRHWGFRKATYLLEVYWAMAFILPKGIINEMIKRLRTFLWKGTSSSGYPKVGRLFADQLRKVAKVRLRDCSIWTAKDNKGAWGWRKMLTLRHTLLSHIHFRIGDGTSFLLWHDPWHTLGPLISQFPRGPQMTNIEPLDKLSVVIKDGQWNWPLITDIACLEITHMLPPITEGQDRISWKSNNGSFNFDSL
ncbi:UNVERIFIED_CONTAM: Retrovirus-related Pol polyprotein from type-2 retrotransposable element R2DM [Sesamum calycinum]|uniref:Retrovirus-related Pol polyprotein from type-2 retrotransposable element R2DM n=1 Tax=Sesamum calycinum TaxID=2727403 RepID=A0AAW2L479_9LAMI